MSLQRVLRSDASHIRLDEDMVSERAQKEQKKISVFIKAGRYRPFEGSRTSTDKEPGGVSKSVVSEGPEGKEAVAVGFGAGGSSLPACRSSIKKVLDAVGGLVAVDTREGTTDVEVFALRTENEHLKQLTKELMQENQVLKKRLTGLGWSCEIS